MNLSNFFVDMLSGAESQVSYGTKKNEAPAFLFSDIMKVYESDSSNASEVCTQNSDLTREIFSAFDNVIEILPEDFNNICNLVAQLINQTTNQQSTTTTYNVEEATITKQKFLFTESKLVDFLGNLIERGNNSSVSFLSQLQPKETNNPISISFKSGNNKLSISVTPINITESYTNRIINDEYTFVNKLLVNEKLFSNQEKVVGENQDDLTFNNEDNIAADSFVTQNNLQSFFRTEIIKIISNDQSGVSVNEEAKTINLAQLETSISRNKQNIPYDKEKTLAEYNLKPYKEGNGKHRQEKISINYPISEKIETSQETIISITSLFDDLTDEEKTIFKPLQKSYIDDFNLKSDLAVNTVEAKPQVEQHYKTKIENIIPNFEAGPNKSAISQNRSETEKSDVNTKTNNGLVSEDTSKTFVKLNGKPSYKITESDSIISTKQANEINNVVNKDFAVDPKIKINPYLQSNDQVINKFVTSDVYESDVKSYLNNKINASVSDKTFLSGQITNGVLTEGPTLIKEQELLGLSKPVSTQNLFQDRSKLKNGFHPISDRIFNEGNDIEFITKSNIIELSKNINSDDELKKTLVNQLKEELLTHEPEFQKGNSSYESLVNRLTISQNQTETGKSDVNTKTNNGTVLENTSKIFVKLNGKPSYKITEYDSIISTKQTSEMNNVVNHELFVDYKVQDITSANNLNAEKNEITLNQGDDQKNQNYIQVEGKKTVLFKQFLAENEISANQIQENNTGSLGEIKENIITKTIKEESNNQPEVKQKLVSVEANINQSVENKIKIHSKYHPNENENKIEAEQSKVNVSNLSSNDALPEEQISNNNDVSNTRIKKVEISSESNEQIVNNETDFTDNILKVEKNGYTKLSGKEEFISKEKFVLEDITDFKPSSLAKEEKFTNTDKTKIAKENSAFNTTEIKSMGETNKADSGNDDLPRHSKQESFKSFIAHTANDFNVEKANSVFDIKQGQEPVKVIRTSELIPEFTKVIQQGEKQSMTFQITPENLGKVKLTVDLVNNQVQTKIEVENEQVKLFIQKNVEQLKQNLQSSGIQLTSVNISLPDYSPKHADKTFAMKRKNNFKEEKEIITEEVGSQPAKKMGYNTYEYLA